MLLSTANESLFFFARVCHFKKIVIPVGFGSCFVRLDWNLQKMLKCVILLLLNFFFPRSSSYLLRFCLSNFLNIINMIICASLHLLKGGMWLVVLWYGYCESYLHGFLHTGRCVLSQSFTHDLRGQVSSSCLLPLLADLKCILQHWSVQTDIQSETEA